MHAYPWTRWIQGPGLDGAGTSVDQPNPFGYRHLGARLCPPFVAREEYGTHSLRSTKAAIIYKATGNLRAVKILLGHTRIENTVRYLGVDVEDALTQAEGRRSPNLLGSS